MHPDFISEDATIEALMHKFVGKGYQDLVWQSDDAGIVLGGHSFKSDRLANVLSVLTGIYSKQIATRTRLNNDDDEKTLVQSHYRLNGARSSFRADFE